MYDWLNMRLTDRIWALQLRLFGRFLGKLFFYQNRSDSDGNVIPPRRIFTQLNQRLIEAGLTPPWIYTRGFCQHYWKSVMAKSNSGNDPFLYAQKDTKIVNFLSNFWTSEVSREDSILELGCNCGANLNFLMNNGYQNLAGIEINLHAVDQMRQSFPKLAQSMKLYQGSLESVLPQIPDNTVDVSFSMAVLIHIHPSSNIIFSEIKRITKKYIAVIELETSNRELTFIRNYRRVFEKLGCSQMKSILITKDAFPSIAPQYYGYTARLFRAGQPTSLDQEKEQNSIMSQRQ